MELKFNILTAEDARLAADTCDAIADSLAGVVSPQDTVKTRRGRKATAGVTPASAPDITAAYNAIASRLNATGATHEILVTVEEITPPVAEVVAIAAETLVEVVETPVEEITPPVVETVQPEVVQLTVVPATEPATVFDRPALIAATKAAAMTLGFTWVRANVTAVYGRTKLDELTDAEIQAVHDKAVADAAVSL